MWCDMKLKRFDDFTYIFLVNASQMAYLEDAQKTHDMLQQFNELYRYMMRSDNSALLGEELKALRNHIDIQIGRHKSRFNITLGNNLKNNDIYIKHLSVLDFIDNIMNIALSKYETHFNVSLELKNDDKICLNALVGVENEEELFTIKLTERG